MIDVRLLFEIDTKDYDKSGKTFVRPSVRSIIIKNGRVAMIHSLKFDYYKFPGGGIEADESKAEALLRETLEESGLKIIPSTIREYGYVHRVQKSKLEDVFIQDNFYYLCEVEDIILKQKLEKYEADELFVLEFVEPLIAINANRNHDHAKKEKNMIEREARVL